MEYPMKDMMNDVTAASAGHQTDAGIAATQSTRRENCGDAGGRKSLSFVEYVHMAYSTVREDIERMENDEDGIYSLPPSIQLLDMLVTKGTPNARSDYEVLGITWVLCEFTDKGLMQAAEELWEGYETTCKDLHLAFAESYIKAT
jgi:hypothetical protein